VFWGVKTKGVPNLSLPLVSQLEEEHDGLSLVYIKQEDQNWGWFLARSNTVRGEAKQFHTGASSQVGGSRTGCTDRYEVREGGTSGNAEGETTNPGGSDEKGGGPWDSDFCLIQCQFRGVLKGTKKRGGGGQ